MPCMKGPPPLAMSPQIATFSELRQLVMNELRNPDQTKGVPCRSLPALNSILKGSILSHVLLSCYHPCTPVPHALCPSPSKYPVALALNSYATAEPGFLFCILCGNRTVILCPSRGFTPTCCTPCCCCCCHRAPRWGGDHLHRAYWQREDHAS